MASTSHVQLGGVKSHLEKTVLSNDAVSGVGALTEGPLSLCVGGGGLGGLNALLATTELEGHGTGT